MLKKIFLALALILISPTLLLAQSSGEKITNFGFTAELSNSEALVTENIDYDFAGNDRQGIFRNIPTQYIVEGDQGYELDFRLVGVRRDGRVEDYHIEEKSGFVSLRIGQEGTFINGEHSYELVYELSPVVIRADDGTAVVRFDVPGTGWEVPVEQVNASIFSDAQELSSTCYQGELGSSAQSCTALESFPVQYVNSHPLAPGETLTIESVYDSDNFSKYAELTTIGNKGGILQMLIPLLAVGLTATVVVGSFAVWGYHAIRYRRRRAQETVVPLYEPPKGLSPAELGLLVDNSARGAELSASILDLAVHGYMKISQIREKSLFRSADYSFERLRDGNNLNPWQKAVFDSLFDSQANTVKLSKLKTKSSVRTMFPKYKKKLTKSLEGKGFYAPMNILSSSLDARVSENGYKKWAEAAGFREFLQMTMADRIKFTDAPERRPEKFSEFLPYAVAFGVEKEWAKQFEDLAIDVSGWYDGGSSHIAAASLANNIGGLSSSLNSLGSAASSSGSSGAGGGFSGGGFSGGGGGSW